MHMVPIHHPSSIIRHQRSIRTSATVKIAKSLEIRIEPTHSRPKGDAAPECTRLGPELGKLKMRSYAERSAVQRKYE
jgi:hypothetical protein